MHRRLFLLILFASFAFSARGDDRPLGTRFAVAIEDHDVDAVKALLDGGAAADTPIDYGEHAISPLMKAAWDRDLPIVELLVARGANVNYKTADSGETALMNAVTQEDASIVKLLLAAKADVNPKNKYDFNAFTSAVATGNQEIVGMLLDAGAKINEGSSGLTPLTFAAASENIDMMKFLVTRGADVNYGAKQETQTALMTAIYSGKLESVKALIALKADVNARMKDGDTPLKAAQKGDQEDMIAVLKAAGAKK
ncbi:MAG: ankyrin repeat domain-containing protein [Acidobacteriota bacterium]